MTGLVIIAHAPLASALEAVAKHTFPDCAAQLSTLDVRADMTQDQVLALATALLSHHAQGEVLILTDVFGATPCNVAQRLADGVRVKVVAGVNVPMLWRSLCYAHESLDALTARALAGASQGVMQVGSAKPQHQTRSASDPDAQGNRHDQQ